MMERKGGNVGWVTDDLGWQPFLRQGERGTPGMGWWPFLG
jgi:hypothetical protein